MPCAAPLRVCTGLVTRLIALCIASSPPSFMESRYSLVPWIFSITTMALISPTRFLSMAVETAVKTPNLESIR